MAIRHNASYLKWCLAASGRRLGLLGALNSISSDETTELQEPNEKNLNDWVVTVPLQGFCKCFDVFRVPNWFRPGSFAKLSESCKTPSLLSKR